MVNIDRKTSIYLTEWIGQDRAKPTESEKSKDKRNRTVQPLQTKNTEITKEQQSKQQETEMTQARSVTETYDGGLKNLHKMM